MLLIFKKNKTFLTEKKKISPSSLILINDLKKKTRLWWKNLKRKKNNLNFILSKKKISIKKPYCIRIKASLNNIFCTFWSITTGKTLIIQSAGLSKIKPGKKRINFYIKNILKDFFKKLKVWRRAQGKVVTNIFFFSLRIPKKLRRYVLYTISRKASLINFEYVKPFNGCKAKKKRRKKRLGLRRFK